VAAAVIVAAADATVAETEVVTAAAIADTANRFFQRQFAIKQRPGNQKLPGLFMPRSLSGQRSQANKTSTPGRLHPWLFLFSHSPSRHENSDFIFGAAGTAGSLRNGSFCILKFPLLINHSVCRKE